MNDYLNYYRNAFLTALQDMADLKSQEKAWINGDHEKLLPFSEVLENFMSASEDIQQGSLLSKEQRKKLQKLIDMVDDYGSSLENPQTDSEIAKDPKWHEIRKYAQEVYDELKNIKIDT
ncbi:MAG: hypothetical protein KFB93_01415 [Simkaniaceae bacterium]|jgi:uncharacterized protein YaaR (DUF327 family)|nr:MAG: hypothetical protein KFB93_01415 [Simkaniaceae bacterium]